MASSPDLTWRQVLRWRMERHFLSTVKGKSAVDVAKRVSGVHAQLASSASAAIRLRTGLKQPEAAIERGLTRSRTLVKTWAARGTLHLLATVDYPLWVAAMSTRSRETKPSWLRYHKTTAPDMAALREALPSVLADAPLTRTQLADRVVELTGRSTLREPLTQGWGAVLKPAAFQGVICFGPPDGRNVTFVSPAAWLGEMSTVDSPEAIDRLVLAYLGAYGPADHHEFARWFDLSPSLARAAFLRLASQLERVNVEGRAGMLPAPALASIRDVTADGTLRFLPAFDPYVIGSLRQLDAVVVGDHAGEVSRPQGWISPTIVLDGRIVGTWRADDTSINLFQRVPAKRLKLAAEEAFGG